MDEDLPEAARRVRQALADAGIADRIRQLPQSARTADCRFLQVLTLSSFKSRRKTA